jgi:gamma-glutamyl-gamma-aminobutyrate hydrolase PuuD
MQIVIDIDDKVYEMVMNTGTFGTYRFNTSKAIQHGTPLPKGHGKLFDEKEINTVVNGVFNDFDKHSPETFLNVIHNQCIEAVGADKAESEGEG